jgi:AsmA family/AsmA-like C-terminal region
VKFFSSKRRVTAAAALVLLTLFMLRPGGSRLKSRITGSLSAALGRSVEIGSVHIRLLPRPGFDLENLIIYDDPAFGSEPMLRAAEVTAALRLASLVRGRIEVARLDLTEPSLNLVQGENGRWNLEALLERSARIPLAPTAKTKSEARPGFPYIEASSARINFKNGQEKTSYALTNADFSLWQDSENTWGVRLLAQPFRSDLSLNDTGLLRVNGTWQRANSLRETPLEFQVEWDRPQLGQLTKFFTGRDSGWRGTVQFDATLTGTPAKLQISSDASIQDFRRYDISTGQALRLAAHCNGKYSSADRIFHEVLCDAPGGDGQITLKGEVGLPGSHYYAVQLGADKFPASAALALVQHAKRNLPADLAAEGLVRGSFSIRKGTKDSSAELNGQGEISDFSLASARNKSAIGPENIPFTLGNGESSQQRSRSKAARKSFVDLKFPNSSYLEVGPFSVALGHGVPVKVDGWFSRSAYRFAIAGEAEVARTLTVARMLGFAATSAQAEGASQLDLLIAGSWATEDSAGASGFIAPQVTGNAKLREVRVGMAGIDEAVVVSSADLQLAPTGVRVTKLNAHAANAVWTGTIDMPRGCGTPDACSIHFDIGAKEVVLDDLSKWINPGPKSRPWYGMLTSNAPAKLSIWKSLRASGRVTTNHLLIRGFEATHLSADVALDHGKLRISDVAADFLGGKYRGEWNANFGVKPAIWTGSGGFTGVDLAQATDAGKGAWSAGTGAGSYQIKTSNTPGDFWQSAEGTLRFDIRDASVPGIVLIEDAGPLKVASFAGLANLHTGTFEINNAQLDSSSGKFGVAGTASFTREIDLRLTRRIGSASLSGYTIAGNLDDPNVTPTPAPQTQAQLKSESPK